MIRLHITKKLSAKRLWHRILWGLTFAGAFVPSALVGSQMTPPPDYGLNISEEDMQRTMQRVTKALEEIPQEKLEQLRKLGEELQARMDIASEKGELDQNDIDSVMDWMSKQNLPSMDDMFMTEPEPAPPAPQMPTIKMDALTVPEDNKGEMNPDELSQLFSSLIKRIERVRDEALLDDDMEERLDRWQGDLDQLVYFLYRLKDKKALEMLLMPENTILLNSFVQLNSALTHVESRLQLLPVHQPHEDHEAETFDPYARLGVPYAAKKRDIKRAYERLRKEYDPEALAKRYAHLSEKICARRIERAVTSFSRIQDAYELLSDEKQRTQLVDRKLRAEIKHEEMRKEQLMLAISSAEAAFSQSFAVDNMLENIKRVFEQLAPQELALAQKHEQGQALKRQESQRKRRIARTPRAFAPQEDQYEQFYRKIEQEEWQRRAGHFRSPRPSFGPSAGPGKRPSARPAKPGEKPGKPGKPSGKKPDKKKDKKGKEDKKKPGKKEAGKPSEKKEPKVESIKEELFQTLMGNVGATLGDFKDKKITLAPDEPDGAKEEYTLGKAEPFMTKIQDYLRAAPVRDAAAEQRAKKPVVALGKFIKETRLPELYKAITKLSGKFEKDSFKSSKLEKEWEKLMTEKGGAQLIVNLKKMFYDGTTIAGANIRKKEEHGLANSVQELKNRDIKDPSKDIPATGVNLGAMRYTIDGIVASAEKITKKLGLPKLSVLAVPPKK